MPMKTLLICAAALCCTASALPHYTVTDRLAGPDGGWDYAAVDPSAHRLYVARSTSVTIIDLEGKTAPRSVGDLDRGHAALPIPGTSTILVTSGNDASVRIIEEKSGAETGRIAVGQKADAAIFDPATRHVFVANAKDGSVSEIDVMAAKTVRTIQLRAGLEFEAIGPGPMLFVNNEETNSLETVNLSDGKKGPEIALPGCDEPSGLAYDSRSGLLISACANGKAAITDARTRTFKYLVDIGGGPDAVILDPKRRLALIPCGRDGVLDILSLGAAGRVRKIGSVKTEVGARTGALDPATGRVYLPTAHIGAPATPGGRGVPVQGTFHVLVLAPS